MTSITEKVPLSGDMIVADRGLYKHYGIYIGNGRVIHYSAGMGIELDAAKAKIIETSLVEFLDGSALYVEESDEPGAFPPDRVVERARSMVGRLHGEYNIAFNNCEHFTHWCKYGTKESSQVNTVLKAVVGVAAIALGLAAGGKFLGGKGGRGLI